MQLTPESTVHNAHPRPDGRATAIVVRGQGGWKARISGDTLVECANGRWLGLILAGKLAIGEKVHYFNGLATVVEVIG